ncbi:DUF2490 domain-containing protein [Hymenobacter weizhouensis]|uniref:DUF2490 domain-containing protein n=1 Tax=Hymenobacter sp. YIM 151500-1 TaxID=2987689 RepID=UPI0022266694|nr:DUF2490 domain-containing protein [Hymenobacter sp. YIM 151500-1]UYZ62340.1 DUF2490 domain-containing protein [Hymenobacter sp. YIM 151500-1]
MAAPVVLPALARWAGAGLLAAGLLLAARPAAAQNTRLNDRNTIGWLTNTTTLRFAERWSGHLEYQFRRENGLADWQQSLLRTGVNYQVNDRLTVRLGYAWIETFPYGDYPIQAAGRQFPEHRIYQMATLSNPIGRVEVSHRFMLEQRWFGRFLSPTSPDPDEWVYVNRLRYMARVQVPLSQPGPGGRGPYAAAYDEIFLGFGRNVNENVFDQNRLALLLGYRFGPAFRIEGGFFQQRLQLPREIEGRNVFQRNNGFIVNTVVNLDLRRSTPATPAN